MQRRPRNNLLHGVGRCNGGEARTNDWGVVEEEEEENICDVVWGMLEEEENRRRFALL